MWGDYQRKLTADNFFALQKDITGDIAGAVKAELTAREQKQVAGVLTENLPAYRLYVKDRSQRGTRSE